jgi:hypothetical protein
MAVLAKMRQFNAATTGTAIAATTARATTAAAATAIDGQLQGEHGAYA